MSKCFSFLLKVYILMDKESNYLPCIKKLLYTSWKSVRERGEEERGEWGKDRGREVGEGERERS